MLRRLLIICICFTACQTKQDKDEYQPAKRPYYVYAPRLNVQFDKGDSVQAANVLGIWKGYEAHSFLPYLPLFTDSITFIFENEMITGRKEEVLKKFNDRRKHISTIQVHADFWQPMYVKSLHEQWILIWGKLEGTTGTASRDSWNIHQVWRCNASGKIYFMQEYRSRFNWEQFP